MRINLNRIDSLPDFLTGDGFELLLGNLPSVGDSTNLTLKVLNTNIPGFSTEPVEANLHGFVKKQRGRKVYPRTLQVTYLEDTKFDTYNKLRGWMEFIVGSQSGTSAAYKNSASGASSYAVNADLVIYDTVGREANRVTFWKMFLQEVGDVQISGENTALLQVSATFSYDEWTSLYTPAR